MSGDVEWSTPTQLTEWASVNDPTIVWKVVKHATVVGSGSGGGGTGPQGPRGTGMFVSGKELTDESFDPEVDILGYPEDGLIPGDLVIDPTGAIYVWEE